MSNKAFENNRYADVSLKGNDNNQDAFVPLTFANFPHANFDCLVDTGAAKSVLKAENIPSSILTGKIINGIGLGGVICPLQETKPVKLKLGNQTEIITSLLVSSSTPENLLGVNVLSQIQACIQYTPDGIKVTTPLSDEVLNQASAAILLAKCVDTADIPDLSQVPETQWAIDRYDVGLLNVTPVHVKLKEGAHLPHKPQYPLNPQQIEGIQLQLDRYLEKDVVAKCTSPGNTPLFPVKKKGNQDNQLDTGWYMI